MSPEPSPTVSGALDQLVEAAIDRLLAWGHTVDPSAAIP